jgi:hypothetical protein
MNHRLLLFRTLRFTPFFMPLIVIALFWRFLHFAGQPIDPGTASWTGKRITRVAPAFPVEGFGKPVGKDTRGNRE